MNSLSVSHSLRYSAASSACWNSSLLIKYTDSQPRACCSQDVSQNWWPQDSFREGEGTECVYAFTCLILLCIADRFQELCSSMLSTATRWKIVNFIAYLAFADRWQPSTHQRLAISPPTSFHISRSSSPLHSTKMRLTPKQSVLSSVLARLVTYTLS